MVRLLESGRNHGGLCRGRGGQWRSVAAAALELCTAERGAARHARVWGG